jgi:demethylspheroidene O-methyltransferase
MGLLNRLAASRAFQSWAARVPGLRRIARAEGEALFADIAGFVRSQVLMALVELDLLSRLGEMPATPEALALRSGIAPARLDVLLQAGAAMGLLRRRRDGRFVLARRGAAILGVPGLPAMIRHHRVLYRDLSDPVAFLRGETDPDLARFWPYVFGAAAAEDPETARHYSGLMADSQVLVAEDTLRLADLTGVRHLMDVGGGTGAFLTAVAQAQPGLSLTLFDLPAVLAGAGMALARDGLGDRVTLASGSFRDDPLPAGADAISLVRVLYDHSDETVAALLSKVFDALPPRGRIVVSEPMSGGAQPDPVTDTYFAFYTMAMRTGRTRSGEEIAGFLARAGFGAIRVRPGYRPFVTSVVEARRPDSPAG